MRHRATSDGICDGWPLRITLQDTWSFAGAAVAPANQRHPRLGPGRESRATCLLSGGVTPPLDSEHCLLTLAPFQIRFRSRIIAHMFFIASGLRLQPHHPPKSGYAVTGEREFSIFILPPASRHPPPSRPARMARSLIETYVRGKLHRNAHFPGWCPSGAIPC